MEHEPKIIIIPHAGKEYAGDCRRRTFERVNGKRIKWILFLATMHRLENNPNVDVLYSDINIDNEKFAEPKYEEHSFWWVKKELNEYFAGAKILALGAHSGADWITNWVVDFYNTHPNTLIVATIDLTHFNSESIPKIKYPQQQSKIIREEKLIEGLCNLSEISPNDASIADGIVVVKIITRIAKKIGCNGGKVVDYYDSSNKKKRYEIDVKPVISFVSYVGIAIGDFGIDELNELWDIDIKMALGMVKSVVSRDVRRMDYELRLPSWSPFYAMRNGVFVGTTLDNKVNSSTGQFQTNKSTASNIINASANIVNDSIHRWKNPLTETNIDRAIYKVELLQNIDEWKTYKAKDVAKVFNPRNGKYGVLLTIKNGRATYLPKVGDEWSVKEYMEHLSLKAGGGRNRWFENDATIGLYTSVVFITEN